MKYFPFLRGRQTEFLILRDLAGDISKNGSVIPIIEPETVTSKKTLNSILGSIDRFKKERMLFLLIYNPRHGKLSKEIESVLRSYKNWIPALRVDKSMTVERYKKFTSLYSSQAVAVIYCGEPEKGVLNRIKKTNIEYHVFLDKAGAPRSYKESIPKANRVYVRNTFNRRHSNREYPRGPEFFTDMNTKDGNPEEINFGDFSIVGDNPPRAKGDGWGEVYAVALHHIHLAKNSNCLEVSHFLSDRKETPGDASEKIIEALAHLLKDLPSLRTNNTSACNEYKEIYANRRSTNIAKMNKLAIKHHLEVMMTGGLLEF